MRLRHKTLARVGRFPVPEIADRSRSGAHREAATVPVARRAIHHATLPRQARQPCPVRPFTPADERGALVFR
jgi:hypothetical protein